VPSESGSPGENKMILLHEGMPDEAIYLKRIIEHVFAAPVQTISDCLDRFFTQMPEFEGYHFIPHIDLLKSEFSETAVLLLTPRDLYDYGTSREDEWVFGERFGNISVAATARLMGQDSTPRTSRTIDEDLYLRRVGLLGIHELGHDLVKAPHHKEAFWINVRSCYSVSLGGHCDDNSCAMYEFVDIAAPSPDEGYLKLGDDQLFDAGIDEHLNRLRQEWFCSRCRNHLEVTDDYRRLRG